MANGRKSYEKESKFSVKASDLFTVNDENYTNWKLVLQTTKFFCSLNIRYFITTKIVSIFPSLSAVQIYDFHVFTVVYSPLHGFIWNQLKFVSSVGRALYRYRRGHGFKSRTGLNFFQALFSLLLK